MNLGQEYSTRKQIVTLIKTKGSISVNDLSKQLGITEMAVRRHLNTLERDGLVEAVLVRQAMGRPAHLYSLTDLADDLFPKNYHSLTLDLLEELDWNEHEDPVGVLFERRRDKLVGRYAPRMNGKLLKDKVSELTEIQKNNGYMAEWEQDENGNFLIKEYNCPISQVANQYEHACRCELDLFESLLKAEVERTECLVKDGKKCVYLIQNQPD